jgi:hypothetical protein
MATPAVQTPPAPTKTASPARPDPPAAAPEPAAKGPSANDIPTWEADLATLTAETPPPAPAAPPTAPPADKLVPPAEKPTPDKPPTPPPPPPKPGTPPAKPPAEPRKSKLDPDELLSVDGLESVELPEDVVKSLATIPASDLRVQSAKLAKGYRMMAARMKETEAKLKEASEPKPDPEVATLKERVAVAEKELRHAAFLKSPEYKEKFETPFFEKLNEAYSFIKELSYEGDDGAARTGTQQDFDKLLEMGHQAASKQAEEMFGPTIAAELMAYRRSLAGIRQSASKEAEKYKAEGEKIERERLVQREQQRKAVEEVFKRENEAMPKKYPDIFGEIEGDDEGNQLLKQSYAEVDKSQDPSLPLEEKISRLVAIRHRAAALPREIRRRKAAEARITELEEALKAYEESTPTKGVKDGAPPPPIDDEEDPMAVIDRMATPIGG